MAELRVYAVPSYLYRYRPLGNLADRELEALKEGYVYCSRFSDMNDPMEGKHKLSLRMVANGTSAAIRQEVLEAQQRLGVASFSEVYDHEPMWAHYADQFRGMCVQYNTRRLLNGLGSDIDLARMMYSERPPTVLEAHQSPEDRARLTLSSKTARWASEREWRIFRPEAGPAAYEGPNTATKIYLGARVSEEDEAAVRDLAKQLGISVVTMKIEAYTIEFTSLRPHLSPKTREAVKRMRRSKKES